jgi:type II secretory pathway component GspD/PulD (secretin)
MGVPVKFAYVTARFKKLFLIILLVIPFTFLPWFSPVGVAASSSPEAQKVQNPNVTFEKGLLMVQAKEVSLKALLNEIGQKAGIGVSVSPALESNKVSIQFENFPLEAGLKVILKTVGVVNHPLV